MPVHPINVDSGAVLTELAKYAVVGIVSFVIAKGTKWFEGYRKTGSDVVALTTSVNAIAASIGDLRQSVDERLSEMDHTVERRFGELHAEFQEQAKSVHRWKNETQQMVNRQESRIIRLEERFRTYMLMTVGHQKLQELESLLPPLTGDEEDPAHAHNRQS